MPTVSVIMPVFNGGPYLKAAIDSVLGQTFADFELLVVDDGSTDGSAEAAGASTDCRVRVLRNDCNRGLVYTANRGLDAAAGKYVAVMHADDLCRPDRLERQVAFLDRRPGVGVVGGWFARFGSTIGVDRPPVRHDRIAAGSLFACPFGHPTVMLRADVLNTHQLRYRADAFPAEDWDLWARLWPVTRVANLSRILLDYRVHAASVTGTQGVHHGPHSRAVAAARRLFERLLSELGVPFGPHELDTHTAVAFSYPLPPERVAVWLHALLAANRRTHVYPEPAFREAVGWMWLKACFHRPGPLAVRAAAWAASRLARLSARAAAAQPRLTWDAIAARRAYARRAV